MMRICHLLLLLLVACWSACAQPAEPPMDALSLADGEDASAWRVWEATIEPDATHARSGRALRFHVDVNHETGEVGHPIGWPRTNTPVAEDLRDWTQWDFVDFWVYADSSRESLPPAALGFIVRSPNRENSFSVNLEGLRKGEWAHYRFPTANLPNPGDCTGVQFFITEANYAHGDVVDFWIDDLVLLRYAEPTVISADALSRLHYADAPVLRVQVELTGLEEGETAEVLTRLVRGNATLWEGSARLGPGLHTIPLEFSGAPAGAYELQTQISGSERVVTAPVRVLSSPWEAQ